jgi:hypothetical protein
MREGRGLVVLGIGVALALQASHVASPFGLSLGDQISAGYTGISQRAFDARGVAGAHGMWTQVFDAADARLHLAYVHHPALPLQLLRPFYMACERSDRGLRLGMLFLLVGLALVLALGVARDGRDASLATALLALSMPGLVRHGLLVCPPLFGLPGLALAAVCGRRVLAAPSIGAWLLYAAAAFLAGLCDWNAYGLVPALVIAGKGFRTWPRRLLLFGLPFGAAFLVHAGWAAMALGGMERLPEAGARILQILGPFGAGLETVLRGWSAHLLQALGVPGVLVLVLALVARVRRGPGRGEVPGLASILATAALAASLVFWSRSATHDFWNVLFVPAAAAAAGPLHAAACRRRPRLAAGILLGVAACGLVPGELAFRRDRSDLNRERGAALEALLPADAVLLSLDYATAFGARFYARRTVIPEVKGPAHFAFARKLVAPLRADGRPVFVAVPAAQIHEHAWVRDLELLPGSLRQVEFPGGALVMAQLAPP